MSGKVVYDISISADGYAAGPGQTADKPFGDGPVDLLHAWMFDTPDENKAEVDQITRAGAYVMGRNMFGPVRGAWDLEWKGCGVMTRPTITRIRAHPPSTRPVDDAGRDDIHIRHRWNPRCSGPGARRCR